MPNYQVQYKLNSQTKITDIEADNVQGVLAICDELLISDITEIRKYVYAPLNPIIPNDDKNYRNTRNIHLKNDSQQKSIIKVYKVKKTITDNDLINYAKSTFELAGKIDFVIDNVS